MNLIWYVCPVCILVRYPVMDIIPLTCFLFHCIISLLFYNCTQLLPAPDFPFYCLKLNWISPACCCGFCLLRSNTPYHSLSYKHKTWFFWDTVDNFVFSSLHFTSFSEWVSLFKDTGVNENTSGPKSRKLALLWTDLSLKELTVPGKETSDSSSTLFSGWSPQTRIYLCINKGLKPVPLAAQDCIDIAHQQSRNIELLCTFTFITHDGSGTC